MESIKVGEIKPATTIVVDTRMLFENGRIYISEYPTQLGKQCDFADKIDITEQVAEAIAQYIKKEE